MSNLTKAFRELRKHGYFARQNFTCCQTCGWAEVPDDKSEKVVFYHSQDNDNKMKNESFYLSWCGDGNQIQTILRENGVETRWEGTQDKRIEVISW